MTGAWWVAVPAVVVLLFGVGLIGPCIDWLFRDRDR